MHFSPPTLHPKLLVTDEQRDLVRRKVTSLVARRPVPRVKRIADGTPVPIPLTTVSMGGNFDAYIQVQFPNPGGDPIVPPSLMMDSGNATLIIPNGEDLVGVPGYTVLGTATEPWGCPANVVQGTLQIPASDGSLYEVENCVFYACTGNNQYGERTANFGMGRVSPWSANGWNTPWSGLTMQSPLSYNTAYPCAEIVYAPAATMFSATGAVVATDGSVLILRASVPSGYTMMNIIQNLEWMAVVPASLGIGAMLTGWPGSVPAPIAMIDTGGGPVFLSDPDGYVYPNSWPDSVACPGWASSSTNCNCVSDRLQLNLVESGGPTSYSYTIDTGAMPESVQGLTAVMCQLNAFMMGQQGMNIGGISSLFNRVLIDYAATQAGLAPKYVNWTQTVEMGPSVDQTVVISPPGVLLGYDFYDEGGTVSTTMTVSWTDLPPGATLYVQHGGSDGAEVVSWSGPDSSTELAGSITATFSILRAVGAAVPIFIFAFADGYLPLNLQLTAQTS
jgi:hypothetical protein